MTTTSNEILATTTNTPSLSLSSPVARSATSAASPATSGELTFRESKLTLRGNFQVVGAGSGSDELETLVVVGVGTGLAYHLNIENENGHNSSGYILTQTVSGKCLGQLTVETPRQARVWLELVAPLADWQQLGLAALVASVSKAANVSSSPPFPTSSAQKLAEGLKALAAQVEAARQEAIARCTYIEERV